MRQDTRSAPLPDVASRRTGSAAALVRGFRPRQWPKNILVAAAPASSGDISRPGVLLVTAVAMVAFVLASGAVYLVNDVRDVEDDRRHPVKRHRPVASGAVAPRHALAIAALLLVVAFTAAGATGEVAFVVVLASYVLLSGAYSFGVKEIPVLELAVVACGFLLRAVGGGAATGVTLSDWFLIVTAFGSLYVVAGKRKAELVEVAAGAEPQRAVLARYSRDYLGQVITMAAAVTLTAYCLWALDRSNGADSAVAFKLTIAPFLVGTLRYGLLIDRGFGEAPEELFLRDPAIRACAALWLVLFLLGVFLT